MATLQLTAAQARAFKAGKLPLGIQNGRVAVSGKTATAPGRPPIVAAEPPKRARRAAGGGQSFVKSPTGQSFQIPTELSLLPNPMGGRATGEPFVFPKATKTKKDETVPGPFESIGRFITQGGLSDITDFIKVVQGPTQLAPVPPTAGRPDTFLGGPVGKVTKTVAGGVVSGAAGAAFFGGNGGTPRQQILQEIQGNVGKRVTAKQVVSCARQLGIEATADALGISEADVGVLCVTAPRRRSRGISAADIRRTNSTLRKMETLKKRIRASGVCRR